MTYRELLQLVLLFYIVLFISLTQSGTKIDNLTQNQINLAKNQQIIVDQISALDYDLNAESDRNIDKQLEKEFYEGAYANCVVINTNLFEFTYEQATSMCRTIVAKYKERKMYQKYKQEGLIGG